MFPGLSLFSLKIETKSVVIPSVWSNVRLFLHLLNMDPLVGAFIVPPLPQLGDFFSTSFIPIPTAIFLSLHLQPWTPTFPPSCDSIILAELPDEESNMEVAVTVHVYSDMTADLMFDEMSHCLSKVFAAQQPNYSKTEKI